MRLVAFTITLKLLEVTKFGISIGIALSLSSVTAIFAEDMEEPLFYHGVRLVVSNSVEVNDDLLKISLGGESFLVQKPGAAREVALRYLRDAKLIDTLHIESMKDRVG